MRVFNPSFLEEIANRPHVRPTLGGEGPVDLWTLCSDPHTLIFQNEWGGLVFKRLREDIYEVHTIFDPKEAKGFGLVLSFARECVHYVFTQTGCKQIVTDIPESNPGARILAVKCGFSVWMESLRKHSDESSIMVYSLGIDKWVLSGYTVTVHGEEFHNWLENEKKERGSQLDIHEDHELHDRYVGAALEMVKAGQVVKGLDFYNAWAYFAGYHQVRLISHSPVVIDIGDALISVKGGELEIVLCR